MRYNGNKFSVYESEEKTVLALLDELGSQVNHNTDNLKTKTDLHGNHLGAWQGLNRPTMSEEGMRATVEDIIDNKIPSIHSSLDNKTYYFTTVADMKSKDLKIGDYVFTTGYYEPNDGGESCYRIIENNNKTCNDGDLIKLDNGLIAELVPKNGEINVVQFGAKIGNRSEDSSKAIQNTINYVYNSYKNGKSYSIVFSGGVYRIDNQIELNYYTRIKSNGLVKIWCANKGNSAFIFKHVPNLDGESKYSYQGFQQSYLIDGSVGGFNICGTNRDTNEGQIGLEYGNNNTEKDYALLKNGIIGVEFSNFTVGMQINVYHNYLMHFENLGFRNCHVGVQFGDVNNTTLVNSGENITFDKCTFGGNAIGIRNYCGLYTKIFRTSFDMNNCAIQFNNRGRVKLDDCWIERNGLTSFVNYQKGKYGIFVNNNEEEVEIELTDCFMTYGGDTEGQQIKEHLIRGNIQLYVRNLKTDIGVDFYAGSKERLFLCREDVNVRNKNEMNCNVFMLSEFSSSNNNTMFQNQSPGTITIKPNETIIGDYLVNEYLTLKSVECLSDGAITNGGRVLKLCALDNTGGAIKLINKDLQPIERGKKIRPLVIYTKGGSSLSSGVSVNVYLYDALGNKIDYAFNGGYTKEGSSFIYRPTNMCIDVTKISNRAVYYKVEYRVYFNAGGGEITLKGLYTYEW